MSSICEKCMSVYNTQMHVCPTPTKREALKFDNDKPDYSLLPKAALDETCRALTFGADNKYGRHNWRAGLEYSRIYAAAMRHMTAFNEGEDNDPESGLSHIAHALCCLMFLMSYIKEGNGQDDRYKGVPDGNI